MSRLISDILEAPEPNFSHTIQSWERKSNRAGHDLRLVSEVSAARKEVLKNLGLDENDTTPEEFYYALRHRAADTNKEFENKLGIMKTDEPAMVAQKVVDFILSLNLPDEAWVLKPTVIKKMLKKMPPRKYLKIFGLRSIDSVLKRSNPAELLASAHRVELLEWTKKFNLQLKNLTPSDFQSQKIHILSSDFEKIKKMKKAELKKFNAVSSDYHTGTILVYPLSRRFELDSLGLALLLLHEMHEVRVFSAYLRHISLKNDFGLRLYRAYNSGVPGMLQDLRIGWKPLQKHLISTPASIGKVEQPYLQPEDLVVVEPFDAVASNIPDGSFWKNGSMVFMRDKNSTASMHLMDVIINASNQYTYEQGDTSYLKLKIWDELGIRYLKSNPIEAAVIEAIHNPVEV